jgi:hypothetical protein
MRGWYGADSEIDYFQTCDTVEMNIICQKGETAMQGSSGYPYIIGRNRCTCFLQFFNEVTVHFRITPFSRNDGNTGKAYKVIKFGIVHLSSVTTVESGEKLSQYNSRYKKSISSFHQLRDSTVVSEERTISIGINNEF